jgi:hypothetical protein
MDVANFGGQKSEVAILIAEFRLRTGHVLGEPLAMLEGDEPVMAAVPNLHWHIDCL